MPKPIRLVEKTVTIVEWKCPYCKEIIPERGGLFFEEGSGLWYHRPCQNKGPVLLPTERSSKQKDLERHKPKEIKLSEASPILSQKVAEEVGPRLLEIVEAARYKDLNRYALYPGRIFGKPGSQDRFKIINLSGNTVIYKDISKGKVDYKNVDDLLEVWNSYGYVEITPTDEIFAKLKSWLTPLIGGVLVAALIAWLQKKL